MTAAAAAFALNLARAWSGPRALGYGSHFGLGLFVPVPPKAGLNEEPAHGVEESF
jgi:hypothetical protein